MHYHSADDAQQFASDNYAAVCPEVWEAMAEANHGHASAYGEDAWTARAADAFRDFFETDCEVFFVFNGTAANSLSLAALCQSYHSVICTQSAHVETDECGAPEFFSNGSKLLTVASPEGKLTPTAVQTIATTRTDIHFPKPKVVTITQSTETGRVYTRDEVAALCDVSRNLGLHLHMDGARFFNAVQGLRCSPAEITWKSGVEVLCCGGTKNGMAIGEAIVFFDKKLAQDFEYRCKQSGQLASKMRYLSAPWLGMLSNSVWQRNADHANECARRLRDGIADVRAARLMFPVEANAVFLLAPAEKLEELRGRGWRFYTFIGGGARFMFAWDSDPGRVDQLAADIREVLA